METSGQTYTLDVFVGDQLRPLFEEERLWERRDLVDDLRGFLRGRGPYVCVLYGLRRTGKSTAMLQVLSEMDEDELRRSAFVQLTPGASMRELANDLRRLRFVGVRNVFVDEVTLADDFIDGAAFLSDVMARSGMRIVLSGTDSLSFWLASCSTLYDRCVVIHSTHIPFAEHARLLGTNDVDDYIRFGGTLSIGGLRAASDTFADGHSTWRYVDSAIAHNIQHSLACYRDGGTFRSLYPLYERGELTNTINRVVEATNHEFCVRTLRRRFKSRDLGSLMQLMRNGTGVRRDIDIDDPSFDAEGVTRRLKDALNILEADELVEMPTSERLGEVRHWLQTLEAVAPYEVWTLDEGARTFVRDVITQPGLRFSQAQELVHSLMTDAFVQSLPAAYQEIMASVLAEDVMGRMLEEIVLYETQTALADTHDVFKLAGHGPVSGHSGMFEYEIDMVVRDSASNTCALYEVKHTERRDERQGRWLRDERVVSEAERRFGRIASRTVLYCGESARNPFGDGIDYANVSEYLLSVRANRPKPRQRRRGVGLSLMGFGNPEQDIR